MGPPAIPEPGPLVAAEPEDPGYRSDTVRAGGTHRENGRSLANLTPVSLIERDEVLASLHSALDDASAGHGRVVLIRGEAGIGKTAVTRVFVESVREKSHLLWGGCDDLVAARPLGPVWDMAFDEPSLLESLEQDDRQRTFTTLYELFNRSLRPTVVVIEDVHWADEATLDLIKFLGRRIERTHGLMVLTYRDEEVGGDHPLRNALGDLPYTSVERISLPPLTPAGVVELARDRQDTDRLWEITRGNPFFVTELIDTGDDVPLSIRDAVRGRVLRLSKEGRELVELVSVAPGRLELALARQALGEIDVALAECEESNLLEVRGEALAFRHELARRAVEGELPEVRRRRLNLAVLGACEALGEDVSRCAHHARAASDPDAMVQLLPEAARRASELESHHEAVSHLRALEPYLERLSDAELADHYDLWAYEEYLSSNTVAGQIIDKAVEIRRRLDDPQALGASLLTASLIAWVSAERDLALVHAYEASSILEEVGGQSLGMAYSTVSQLAMLANEEDRAIEFGEKALAQAGPGTSRVRAHALNNIGTAKTNTDYPAGIEELEESYRIAHQLGLIHDETRAVVNLAWGHLFARELERAFPWLQRGDELMRDFEMPAFMSYVNAIRALYHEMAGEWDEAESRAQEIIDREAVLETSRAAASMVLGKVYVRRGHKAARQTAMRAWERAVKADEIQRLSPAGAVLAEFAWLGGDVDEVLRDELRDVLDRCVALGASWLGGELAFWLSRLNVIDQVPDGMSEPYRLLGRGEWRRAVAFWEGRSVPYELGVALSLGDVPARLRALDIFDRLGATPMATRIRSELHAEGVKGVPRGPQRATRESPLGLTPRQTDVLELLAEHLTNAEIADRLFLSTRTVDHHVSAILTRTGAEDRADAVEIALAAGLIT